MSKEELQTVGIKEKIIVVTYERKVIGKHNHIESVQEITKNILQQGNSFEDFFINLFQKGLPSFWDEDGKFISQYE